jgi:hypothetical protein
MSTFNSMNDIFKSGNDGKAVARPGASKQRKQGVQEIDMEPGNVEPEPGVLLPRHTAQVPASVSVR